MGRNLGASTHAEHSQAALITKVALPFRLPRSRRWLFNLYDRFFLFALTLTNSLESVQLISLRSWNANRPPATTGIDEAARETGSSRLGAAGQGQEMQG